MRKTLLSTILALFLVLCLAGLSMAQSATKDECVAKCKQAVELIKKLGPDAAFAKISDKNGEFVWKGTYVFCIDTKAGVTKAHANPKMIGKNHLSVKDRNGKLFMAAIVETAVTKGEGWVDYVWPKPGEKDPSPKTTYILKVPGENILAAAGIYK